MNLRTPVVLSAFFLLAMFAQPAQAKGISAHAYKAVAFDYFVIFDPNSVVPEVEKVFPGKGLEFTKAWRAKQFEYCFLRSITGEHADFLQVTGDSLDYTAQQMRLDLTAEKREQLIRAYSSLKPWPDTVSALKKLKAAGIRIIALSNFTPKMLRENSDAAGISSLFDDLLSTETNGTFKPDPNAYALGIKALDLSKDEIVFAAFGSWDAYGARSYGYPTVWVNRFDLPPERLGKHPDRTTKNLDGLLEFVLDSPHP